MTALRYFFLSLIFILLSISGFSQNLQLAKNYFDQGEYAKAETIYQKLYNQNKNSISYLKGLVSSLQEQEKYNEAGKALKAHIKRTPNYPNLKIELGHNYQLQGDPLEAEKYYQKAISSIKERPNYAYMIGSSFQEYNLLPEAVQTYKIAIAEKPNPTYTVQLARIYGEQGKLEKMFSTFLDLVESKENYYQAVNRNFAQYITEDPENEANQILRKLLLKRVQQNPEVFYNKLLSWLFIQQNDFKKAFIQQKAIYQRSENKSLSRIIELASIAAEKNAVEDAEDILNYAIDQAKTPGQKISAYSHLMAIKVDHAKENDYRKIDKKFNGIFTDYGKGLNTLGLQLQYAKFLAFKQGKTTEGKNLLNTLLQENLNRFEEARIKMQLADILVAEENFNKALIYYSQIKTLVKNSPLAQEASFKVAKTSYYKGDFDWAQTQLKILKTSTSELIANDAMELSLLIDDNTTKDSTQTALKLFAKADLLAVQEHNKQALAILDSILVNHKGEKIEDEALFRSAKLHEKQGDYEKAEAAYKKIITYYGDDILADDAYYYLAELYRTKLNEPEKAKDNYEQIIFHHADSIFFVDSRKKFRKLRGDSVE